MHRQGDQVDIRLHESEEKAWRQNGCRINGTWVVPSMIREVALALAVRQEDEWSDATGTIVVYCSRYKEKLGVITR